jgi:hypothetical protein
MIATCVTVVTAFQDSCGVTVCHRCHRLSLARVRTIKALLLIIEARSPLAVFPANSLK